MIKYFLVNNASRASAYGIGTYIKQMTSFMRHRSSQYEMCFLDIYSDVKEFALHEDENGIKHYQIPVFEGRNNLLYYKSILFWLDFYLKNDEPIIFHFNYHQHFDLIKLVKAKYLKCRIVFTIHYMNWGFALHGNLSRFKRITEEIDVEDDKKENVLEDYKKEKRLFSFCDVIIVLSKFTYKLLKEDYKISSSKIHLVYNGMKEDKSITEYTGRKKKSKEILFVGRLDEAKGVEFIIKAFKKLHEKQKDIHLTFVGDGNFGQYLPMCENVWDKVTFTGKISHDQLESFYNRATIGVLPSFNEQCSYTAIEMMAHGIPFIATDSTGLGEMMEYTPENMVHIDEKNFNPDSFVEKLAQKMEILLFDNTIRKKTSRKLLRLFQERYHLDSMKSSMNVLFEKNSLRNGYLSSDFLPYLDEECIRLINNRPVMDMDFVGLTGLGCYMWFRITSLERRNNKASQVICKLLQKHMFNYIDWVSETIHLHEDSAFPHSFDPRPIHWLIHQLLKAELYKTKVIDIICETNRLGIKFGDVNTPSLYKNEILQTALKIYNTNF